MKTLYLIFSKIRMIIRESPFIFAVLCIGMTACNLMFIYMYGVAQDHKRDPTLPDYYVTYIGNGEQLCIDEISRRVAEVAPRSTVRYYTTIDADATTVGEHTVDAEQFAILARNDDEFFDATSGRTERLAEKNTVLVPEEYRDTIYSTIVLNGREFEVVGTTIVSEFFLSRISYIENGFLPDLITVRIIDNGETLQALSEQFGDAYTVEHKIRYAVMANNRQTQYELYAIYILCALTFLFLCTYIYEDSAYELGVYQMLGASRGKLVAVLSGVMFVLLSTPSLAAQVLHVLLFDAVFTELFTQGVYVYTLRDYAAIYLTSTAVIEAFVILYLLLKTRKSAIQNVRRTIR
ncbi:MAG: ABC transporter permease [Clostridia bacterium]|nr:ABC transporter permease [Clostridia bacterium]